jgi:amidase
MALDDLCFLPAVRLVQMLRNKEISSTELTDAFLERIESHNHKLNAVVTLAEQRASEEAEGSDNRIAAGKARPLEGLPITIKDALETAGLRSTNGMKAFEHNVPAEDAPVVARLRAAGAIIVAKTNVPEMSMDYDCDNPVFGSTNNPWNLKRVPGGSSGGEAAALASGFGAFGFGGDYAGSIRVPAHFCGITGLKPSWGTIPGRGHMPGGPAAPPPIAQMATLGPLARYVDDLTMVYNLVRGPHPETPNTAPSIEARPDRVDLKKLKCATFTNVPGLPPVAKDIRATVERAARALEKVGVVVESKTPPVERGADLWQRYAMADGNLLLHGALGDKVHLSRERLTKGLFTQMPSKSAAEFFMIAMERDIYRIELAKFMEHHPIVICAPFCVPAFPHGAFEVDIDGASHSLYNANWPALWVNCAGLPGAVVPAGLDSNGLPIGVQIVGRAFDEENVLAVAKALESELGGFQRPPA